MSARTIEETERRGHVLAELAKSSTSFLEAATVRPIGRLRIPLTLTHRPWATLYRLPDGRRWWIVRLWETDRPVARRLSTAALRAYALANHFVELATEIDRLDAAAGETHRADPTA